jgi:hypothetical protein
MALGGTFASPEHDLGLENIDERTPDVATLSTETIDNGMVIETTGLVTCPLYAIRDELPFAFSHTYHYSNNYDSENTSTR